MSQPIDIPTQDHFDILELECLDSGSSFSSLGSEKTSYRHKFEEEQQRSKKLEDKIEGYKTVAKLVPKYQEQISELQRKEAEKDKLIAQLQAEKTQAQQNNPEAKLFREQKGVEYLGRTQEDIQPQLLARGDTQGLTDLSYHRSRGNSQSSTRSPSFVIIKKGIDLSSAEQSSCDTKQSSRNSPTEQSKLPVSLESTPKKKTSDIGELTQQNNQTFKRSDMSEAHKLRDRVPENDFQKQLSAQMMQYMYQAQRGYSDPSACVNHEYYLSHQRTRPQSQYMVMPPHFMPHPSARSVWQMEQEKNLSAQAALTNAPTASSMSGLPSTDEFNKILQTSAYENPSAPTHFQLPLSSYGIGARPKEWKPINTNASSKGISTMANSTNISTNPFIDTQLRRQNSTDMSQALAIPTSTSASATVQSPSSPLGTGQDPLTIPKSAGESKPKEDSTSLGMGDLQPLVDVTSSGDLLKFSLERTELGSPEQAHQELDKNVTNQMSGSVAYPSDVQSQLASQAQSMAAMLKTGGSSKGMSEMMFKFAKELENMEAQYNESQALIQRLQVQIQNNGKHNFKDEVHLLKEEIKSLREENDNLLQFIKSCKNESENKFYGQEPGWVTISPQQHEVPTKTADETLKKMQSLEQINSKLFLANKDWHSKWEILRQNAQEEKEGLVDERGKLREALASKDHQLQDANITNQSLSKKISELDEEKKNLQKAVHSLRSEMEKLQQEKRKLETEISSLKTNMKTSSRSQAPSKELETEVYVLKQQVALFAEDFEKEKQDRQQAEKRLEKMKREKDQMKYALELQNKKTVAQLKTIEKEKSKEISELKCQIFDLNNKMQQEKKKTTTFARQHNLFLQANAPNDYEERTYSVPSQIQTGNYAYPSDIGAGLTNVSSRHTSPEHLPGAWTCRSCTYINYPGRTVCDICGSQYSEEELPSMRNETRSRLYSRGDRDVVVDGPEEPPANKD